MKNIRASADHPCNISEKEQLQNLVDKTREHFGQIDVLVCNAALNPYFGPAGLPGRSTEQIMSQCEIKSLAGKYGLPEMLERENGSIIIVSSIGGLKGSPVIGTYCISKAADFQLVRNLAVEHGSKNVRANAIAPGLIKTYFAKALWDNPDILKQSTSTTLKRIGLPDEIAGAAVFWQAMRALS